MNKRIVLSLLLLFVLFFSISAIQAGDANTTDLAAISSKDNSFQMDCDNQFDELDFLNSNNDSYLPNNGEELISLGNDGFLNESGNNLSQHVDVKSDGDEIKQKSVVEVPVSVVELSHSIKAGNISKYYRGTTPYTATFYDSFGSLLQNTSVTITVNGKSFSKKTNSNGAVSLSINHGPGEYKITATNPVTGYQLTTTFKILSTIVSKDLKKVAGDNRKFSAKFLKSNGEALSNQYVQFKIKGKTYKVKTNSKGQATLSLEKLKKGTYKVICYNKDGLKKDNSVKIYNIASTKLSTDKYFYTFIPNDNKEIKVKLSTSLGYCPGLSIKMKINGVDYYKKTDSKGTASFKLSSFKKGFYRVEYSFLGNKYFKSSKKSNLLTILDSTQTAFTVKSTTRFGHGAGTLFKVVCTAGGVPLAKRTITFDVDGLSYSETTDNNGMASIPINLDIGNYTVGYKTYNQFKVDGASGSCPITVFKRSDSKLGWKCGISYKDSSQSFKVLLTDTDGKPISDGNVELTIGGETYDAKTLSNGYASFKTYVALGQYNVSVRFTGNNNYLESSTSKSVNVKVSKFGRGLNVKDSGHYSNAYLKSTSHCQVNNAKIKSLVKSLTSGLTNEVDKAKALFNYVRDAISYSYYYNSRHGAVGTLNAKSGNCVDQANLLIAMYRNAGLKARYVHGNCLFSDGRFGHVWTQVLIDNTWVVGDPISYKNDLGKIANWNTKNYKLHSRYLSIPF